MKKVKNLIFNSPEIKTIVFILAVIISGILCSAFITEITVEGNIKWKLFYKTTSFWLIIVYLIILYIYNRFIYKIEKNILNFLDNDYCIAYIRKECLPEIVSKYKNDLKSGKQPDELIDIKKELEKLGKRI